LDLFIVLYYECVALIFATGAQYDIK